MKIVRIWVDGREIDWQINYATTRIDVKIIENSSRVLAIKKLVYVDDSLELMEKIK